MTIKEQNRAEAFRHARNSLRSARYAVGRTGLRDLVNLSEAGPPNPDNRQEPYNQDPSL